MSTPILDPVTEQIYYVANIADSHNCSFQGKYTICVTGIYIYQIKGLPPSRGKFTAGDEITYPLIFIFRINSGM